MRPAWLQELRELLMINNYTARQYALMVWERRWLVELHDRQLVCPELMGHSRGDLLTCATEQMQSTLGRELSRVMVETTTGRRPDQAWDGEPLLEVRGEVIALRREPKRDG